MDVKKYVWITTSFEGFHYWKDAPEEVAYLRNPHRHIFHIKLGKSVKESDREIEFITLKSDVNEYLTYQYADSLLSFSCEMVAENLLHKFDASFVEVSEDGENGARIER